MNYLIISRCYDHISIKDSITNKTINYYFRTEKQAIKQHRNYLNLKNVRFEKNLYIKEI